MPEDKTEEKDDVQIEQEEFGSPESTEEVTDGEQTEETPSTSEGGEDTSDDEGSESDEQDTLDEGAEGSDKLDDSTEEVEKDKVQRRIDVITAEKFREKARADALETRLKKLEETSSTHEKVYTEEQLNSAEEQVDDLMTKGETVEALRLQRTIEAERRKNLERGLRSEYKEEKATVEKNRTQQQQEWISVVERYGPDILPSQYSEDPDFNINDTSSQFFQIAKKLFSDPELKIDYEGSGGMLKAVSDAFLELVRIRSKKKSSTEKKLERKIAKDRKKTSLSPGGAKQPETTGKAKPASDLEDYISNRKESTTVKHPSSK